MNARPTRHHILVDLYQALDYTLEYNGLCALYTENHIDAFLAGSACYKQLQELLKFIEQKHAILPNRLKSIKDANNGEVKAGDDGKHVYDAYVFFKKGDLYQTPERHTDRFERELKQTQALEISRFAQPQALKDKGGRAQAAFFFGVYDQNLIEQYIDFLVELSKQSKDGFAVALGSDDHEIALCFIQKEKLWYLINVDNPQANPIAVKDKNLQKKLKDFILNSFRDGLITGFSTDIYTTQQNQELLAKSIATLKNGKYKSLDDVIAQASLVTNRGVTLAYLAANHGDSKTLSEIVKIKPGKKKRRVNLDKQTGNGTTPVRIAVENRQVEALKVLVEAQNEDKIYSVNLDIPKQNGVTPVSFAAEKGYVDELKILVAAKHKDGTPRVNLNKACNKGITSAMCAAWNGHIDALNILIEAENKDQTFRVDLDQGSNDHSTPVLMAAQRGHENTLKALIAAKNKDGSYRVDLKKSNKHGATAVLLAVFNNHLAVLTTLVAAKNPDGTLRVELDKPANDGMTPAQFAVDSGNLKALKILAEAGAKFPIVNQFQHEHIREFFAAWKKRNELLAQVDLFGQSAEQKKLRDEIIAAFHQDHKPFLEARCFEEKLQHLKQSNGSVAESGMFARGTILSAKDCFMYQRSTLAL